MNSVGTESAGAVSFGASKTFPACDDTLPERNVGFHDHNGS